MGISTPEKNKVRKGMWRKGYSIKKYRELGEKKREQNHIWPSLEYLTNGSSRMKGPRNRREDSTRQATAGPVSKGHFQTRQDPGAPNTEGPASRTLQGNFSTKGGFQTHPSAGHWMPGNVGTGPWKF